MATPQGPAACEFQQRRSDVDACDPPSVPHSVRDLQDRLAGTTAHIQYSFPDLERKRLDGAQSQRRQLEVQQVRNVGPSFTRKIVHSERRSIGHSAEVDSEVDGTESRV